MSATEPPNPGTGGGSEHALHRAVAEFTRALRLSCLAVRRPGESGLANEAVAAHLAARDWAEETVRRAGGAG